jgi:hypothetical protein
MRTRTILAAATAPAALAAILLSTAGQASAAVTAPTAAVMAQVSQTKTYTARITQTGVPDTTFSSNAGDATATSDYGPVWAQDDIARNITISPAGPGLWTVTFVENGTYHAFADPNNGNSWTNVGNMHGTISYTVASTNAPAVEKLPASLPGLVDPSSGQPVTVTPSQDLTRDTALGHGYILSQLFPNSTNVTSGPYSFQYTQVQNVQGAYRQAG